MKMKEQNAYLAFLGFLQLVFMATAATASVELFNSEVNLYRVIFSAMIALVAFIIGAAMYTKVFIDTRRRKK